MVNNREQWQAAVDCADFRLYGITGETLKLAGLYGWFVIQSYGRFWYHSWVTHVYTQDSPLRSLVVEDQIVIEVLQYAL